MSHASLPAASQPWLSRSTILILAGFLAGFGTPSEIAWPIRVNALAAAAAGVCAFGVFEYNARRQARADAARQVRATIEILEQRMHRHIVRDARKTVLHPHVERRSLRARDLILEAVMSRRE